MKIAIIIPSDIDNNKIPYIKFFTDVFDTVNYDYDFICWDRNNSQSESFKQPNVYCFKKYSPESNKLLIKLFDYWLFSRFVIKRLNKNNYNYLSVHTIVIAMFLNNYLLKYFNNKYIFDIRDYSPVVPVFQSTLKNLISNSAFTCISSIGFYKWLPKNSKCIISHNIGKNDIFSNSYNKEVIDVSKENLKILTIGHLRNYETNIRLISHLGNQSKFSIIFAGGGIQKYNLEVFSNNKYSNVAFLGEYKKINENEIVASTDFLNIILPNTVLENTLMSNRFYLSIVHRKPMIVNEESIQSLFVKKYKLGLVLNSTDNIFDKLTDYISGFDQIEFEKGCNELQELIKQDIVKFEEFILQLIVNT